MPKPVRKMQKANRVSGHYWVLPGVGQWLDEDREVKDLDRYRMTFPA